MRALRFNRYIQPAIPFIFLAFTIPFQSWAACVIEVHANDGKAIVQIDGKKVSGVPARIKCSTRERQLKVVGSDGQVFDRKIASMDLLRKADQQVNVYFPVRLSTGNQDAAGRSPANTASKHLDLAEVRNNRIEKDLEELKAMVAALLAANPRLARQAALFSAKSEANRSVNSVQEVTAGITRLKGVYVQLHALLNKRNVVGRALREMKGMRSDVVGRFLSFCNRAVNFDPEKPWTRIYVGPFDDRKSAEEVVEKIGKETFVVRNPQCVPFESERRIEN